jgi:hypothetical protein
VRRVIIGGGILLILATVIALALLVGVVFIKGGEQQRAEDEETEATEPPQAELVEDTAQKEETTGTGTGTPPLGGVLELGQTVTFLDRTITVNDIQRDYIFPSNSPKPRAGKEYILVNVTITNTTSQPIDVNSYNFEVEDPNGVRYGALPTNAPPDAINAARVAPNGQLTGNFVFGVQQGVTSVKIVYRPY